MQSLAQTPSSRTTPTERLLYRLTEVAERLGCEVTTVKRLVQRGELRVVFLSTERRVTAAELARYIARLEREAGR